MKELLDKAYGYFPVLSERRNQAGLRNGLLQFDSAIASHYLILEDHLSSYFLLRLGLSYDPRKT